MGDVICEVYTDPGEMWECEMHVFAPASGRLRQLIQVGAVMLGQHIGDIVPADAEPGAAPDTAR